METFSGLLAICAGNSPVTGEFPAQRPVMRSFDVFFHLPLKKNGWVNYGEAGDLRRHRAHYDVIVMDHQVDGITTAARTKHNLATTEVFFDDHQNECTYDWYDCIHDVRISIQFPTTTTQMRSIFTRILKPYCSVKD